MFAGSDKKAVAASPLPLEDLRAFTEVFGKVKSDYVESVDDKDLLEHAIKGMLPKGRLGRSTFKKLKVYRDQNHPHSAQKPSPYQLKFVKEKVNA